MPADVKTWSIREIAVQNRNADVWVWKDLGVHPATAKQTNPSVALACSSILSCVRVISETVASFNIEVYRKKNRSKTIATGHPLYRLLSVSPCPYVTAFSWIETIVAWVCVWGNAYCEIVRSRGVIIRLVPLHPSRMHVEETAEGMIRYSYDNPITGESDYYTPDQLLHFKWLSNDGGLTGMVPVELAADAIELARACDLRALATAKNGASPSIVLETENSVPEPVQEKLRDQWRQIYGGVMNAGKTAILPNGLKAHELGRSNRDNELAAQQEKSLRDIARIYRVPPNMLGLSGGAPQRNPEIAGIELLRSCAGPWILRLEKEIELKLFEDDPDHTPEFDVKSILRTDSASRSRMLTTEIQLGLSTINEGRESEGRPPVEGGDTVLLSHNFNTLEALLAAAQAAAKQAANPAPDTSGLPAPGRQPPGRRKPGKNAPDNPDPAGQQVINGGVGSVAKKLKRKKVAKRSLNPCGQDGGGRFAGGNTCAAKGTSAVVAAPEQGFTVKRPKSELLQTGGVESGAASRAIFEDRTASPGDVLRAYGWKGDSKDIDDWLVALCEKKNLDADHKDAVAAFLVGVGRAVEDFPDIADVGMRATTRAIEADLAEARFREQYGDRLASPENPLGVSAEEFAAALAQARAQAEAPAAYFDIKANEISIIVDNTITSYGMRMQFASGGFSSPAPMHPGYHEAAHAAHAKSIRREAGLPPDGPLSEGEALTFLEVRDRGAFKMATAILTDPTRFAIYRDSPRVGKDSPDTIITDELTRRVSIYGMTNPQEVVAEYLSGVASGGITRDPAVEEVIAGLHAPPPAPPRLPGDVTTKYATERAKILSAGRTSP